MMIWFAKFRIARTLNAGRPLSPQQQKMLARSAELRRYAGDWTAMESALRSVSPPPAPEDLHAKILHAVRRARPARRAPHWRWRTAPAFAVLALLALWWLGPTQHRGPSPAGRVVAARTLDQATSALELGRTLPHTAPAAALAPLEEEMIRLNRDLEKTADYLLASLP